MQTPSAAPVPAPPQPTPITITTQEAGQAVTIPTPMTARDLLALRNRRENLSDQLVSVQSRRQEVAEALRTADPDARPGLQDRLAVLDARIVQLESDIATTGRELTSAPAGLAAIGGDGRVININPGSDDGAFFGGTAFGMALIVVPLMIRRFFRRGRRRDQPAVAAGQADQLSRLEQSIDAIAVEVERISEGQRFTARLMADGQERQRRENVLRDA